MIGFAFYNATATFQVDERLIKHFLPKFDVAGINGQTITNAKLCLYNTDGANAGGDFHHVSDDSWQEETVTWTNAPTAGTQVLASLGAVSPNTWVAVDLTSHITADGIYGLRISDSAGGADYSSKEGTDDPKLLVAVAGATPQSCSGTATATPTSGATATQTPTQTLTPGPSPTPTQTSTPTVVPSVTATQPPPPAAFNNATFVYDGDGRRVKSTINGTTTTYFVGAHYEVTGSTITKYYYAGAQRIAMRTNGTLNYLLGDHLGSTSLTTDSSGQIVSQIRYKAWGEERYTSGTNPTKYTYTGQYSNMRDFGLMFYNARWYDPYLNHFTQPDTIVPDPYNSQDWDRYAYARNNSIRYTDPSGHTSVCAGNNGDPECYAPAPNWMPSLSQIGITLDDGWTALDAGRIQKEAAAMAVTLLGLCGEYCSGMTSYQAFHEVFGDRTINLNQDGLGAGCVVLNCSQGTGGWLGTDSDAQGLIIHEFGHIFDHIITGQWGYGRNVLGGTTITDEFGRYVEGIPIGGGAWTRTNDGYRGDDYPYQQHPLQRDGNSSGEDFADMFMNLVLDYSGIYSDSGFASNPAGQARSDWMYSNMTTWVPWIVQR